jgi:xanthine dehydrogenase accessory factor
MNTGDRSVIPSALGWLEEGRRVALATVIQTWGSAPRPVGSQLAIDGGGNFLGSVSGGCVEGEVIAEAEEVLLSKKPKTLEFGVEDGTAWKAGLACGGTIRIFVEPLDGGSREGTRVLGQLRGDIGARRKAALVTELATGNRRLAHAPGDLGDDLAPALAEAFRQDRSIALPGSSGEIFINVFAPTTRLVIVGAVHVAQALVPMARALGYDVLIVDPRAAFATQERFGDVRIEHDWPDEALAADGLDAATAVVALSHDPKLDDAALISALRSDAFYVGALGSRKTHAGRVERLKQAGIAEADIARIHAPIGLDIGAQGAAEIALSIIAEITAVARGKGGARP